MTFKFMRPALAIALALTLAACGGKASFTVAGTVSGLVYDGLVLQTNGMDLAVPAKATSFAFPNSISYGDVYEVTVKAGAQPAHQTCTVGAFTDGNLKTHGSAKDTAGRLATIDVGVLCTVNAYSISGTITGLTSANLKLTNGADSIAVAAPTGTDPVPFQFASTVPYGTTYGVTVLAQPDSNFCTVSPNGTGVMGDAAVTGVVVTCGPK